MHYARREIHFPSLHVERRGELSLDAALDALRDRPADEGGALRPVGRFVGRDGLFYDLEVAARHDRAVVLHGTGGTGKTELAKAFGRWWRDTGAIDHPNWVVFHSFEPGLASFGLDGVIDEIGLQAFGADFARLDRPERQASVERLLAERRLLLVWDNFEAVHSMPDPASATPPLAEEELERLRGFIARVATSGRSALILTSRSPEQWLGEVRRLEVCGLAPDEAVEYLEQVLAPLPGARSRRARPEFAALLEWLDGHPLSLRLVLPHLETTDPGDLLQRLQGDGELPSPTGRQPGDRTTSLSACIDYSLDRLPDEVVTPLVAASLFHGVADVDVLAAMSIHPDIPERFADIGKDGWTAVLDAAAAVGLLTELGGGMYRVHPVLPTHLSARWRRQEPHAYNEQRAAATQAQLIGCSGLGAWLQRELMQGAADFAFAVVQAERRTLGHLLGHALETRQWTEAQAIAQPLYQYLDSRGLQEEARAWSDRVRLALEGSDGKPPELLTPAGGLWLFVAGFQANQELEHYQLDSAESTYRSILDALRHQAPSPKKQYHLAITYNQLGIVAQRREHTDEAEAWYLRSLHLYEQLKDRPGLATSYHQLGSIAQRRERIDDAKDWYLRSLAIEEEVGNQRGAATSYRQLGIVARMRGQLDEAEDWFTKALKIHEELGDLSGLGQVHHLLGGVAQIRKRFGEAEKLYMQALMLYQQLDDRSGLAAIYHQLGSIAHSRGQIDDAKDWYLRSLAIEEEIGHQRGAATSYRQLGIVAQSQGRLDEAGDWYARALAIDERFGNQPEQAFSHWLLAALAQARGEDRKGLRHGIAHLALSTDPTSTETIAIYVYLKALTEKLGADALVDSWRELTGEELPNEVREALEDTQAPEGDNDG